MKIMAIHPVARLFPTLPKKEMDELRADIKENGIKVPILVNKEKDTIIDGRNRWMVATDLKLSDDEVPTEVFEGEESEIPGAIISRNIMRRHLTDDQRAMLIAKIRGEKLEAEAKARQLETGMTHVPLKSAERKGDAADNLAKEAHVGRDKAREALGVAKHAKDIVKDVISGKVPLRNAAKIAKSRKPKRPSRPRKEEKLERRFGTKFLRLMDYWSPTQHHEIKKIVRERIEDIDNAELVALVFGKIARLIKSFSESERSEVTKILKERFTPAEPCDPNRKKIQPAKPGVVIYKSPHSQG